MKYFVTVKPNAKSTSIKKLSETELHVSVKSEAKDGRANEELIRLVANFLNIPQSHIAIKRGTTGRKKMLEIV